MSSGVLEGLRTFIFVCMCIVEFVTPSVFQKMNIGVESSKTSYHEHGEPLFLTPIIEDGEMKLARKLSRVHSLVEGPIESYSGYITVNKETRSNMFFWFFPSENEPEIAPVILWLNGGPGLSSLFGLFVENGPYIIDEDMTVRRRPYSWTAKYSMLYVDNPVGCGFSFADIEGYAKNESDVAKDLYSFLTQFYQMFNMYRKNDFYIAGESYAGKYVTAISYKIHEENPKSKVKMNFKGMMIGDGLCDPESMMPAYADFLYNTGLIDEKGRDFFRQMGEKLVNLIQNKLFKEAFMLFRELILKGKGSHFSNMTGISDTYNYLRTERPREYRYYLAFVDQQSIRSAIHVGKMPFNRPREVTVNLMNDVMDTVKPWFTTVVENYKVLVYNGQLDVIVPVPMTEAFLLTVPWSGQLAYRNTERQIWKINEDDEEVAGYAKQVGSFYQVIVRDAGHIIPHDQPERGYDMIQRFIEGIGFGPSKSKSDRII